MEYKNFFESQKEASIRLNNTVVLYDGNTPVEILAVTDHVGDGVIRAYVREIGLDMKERLAIPDPTGIHTIHHTNQNQLGLYLDNFIKDNPSSRILRKRLDSPKFNKFRPFELGMYWNPPHVYYLQRQPNRLTQQGLINSMILVKELTLQDKAGVVNNNNVDLHGPEMKRCILGDHPDPYRCLSGLTNNKYVNEAAAFHRHFAFLKGPVDTIFLVYKSDVIGALPNGNFSQIRISRDFSYTREAVDELSLFNNITM